MNNIRSKFPFSFFFTINAHPKLREAYNSDTSRSFDHVPYYAWDNLDEMRLPKGCALVGVDPSARIMQEEIFGPVLPILGVDGVDEAIRFINDRDKPLALYIFADDRHIVDGVLARTTAGGVTVNGTLMHITSPHLPFGGIGESGMGGYHGKAGVRIFQHLKPVLTRGTRIDPSIAYPPYTERKAKLLRRFV